MPEEEWDQFMESMRSPLPVVFRVTSGSSHAKQLHKFMLKSLSKLTNVEVEGQKLESPFQLPWYPGGMAWQINANRSTIRKCEELKKLHTLLISETEGVCK